MKMTDGVFFHQPYAARMVTITLQAAALLCTQAQQDTQRDTSDDDNMMREEMKVGKSAAPRATRSVWNFRMKSKRRTSGIIMAADIQRSMERGKLKGLGGFWTGIMQCR